jgi:hypothetical protein
MRAAARIVALRRLAQETTATVEQARAALADELIRLIDDAKVNLPRPRRR